MPEIDSKISSGEHSSCKARCIKTSDQSVFFQYNLVSSSSIIDWAAFFEPIVFSNKE